MTSLVIRNKKNRRNKIILLIIVLMVWMPVSVIASEVLIVPYGESDWIGLGIDGVTKQPKNACLTGDFLFDGNKSLDLKVLIGQDYSRLLNQTKGSCRVKVDLWIIGAKAKTSMVARSCETDTRASIVWAADYQAGTLHLENRDYSTLGNSILGSTGEEQRRVCGDQFIHSATLGAKILLAANLEFKSKEDYQYYKTRVSFKIAFIKIKKTFTKEIKDFDRDVAFSIKVDQIGGKTDKLNQIIANNLMYCSAENIEACLDSLDKLYTYIESPDGFRSEVSNDSLEVLYYMTENYSDSGHDELLVNQTNTADPGFQEQETRLMGYLIDNENMDETLNAYYQIGDISSEDYNQKSAAVSSNLDKLNNALDICRSTSNFYDCKNNADLAISTLSSVAL